MSTMEVEATVSAVVGLRDCVVFGVSMLTFGTKLSFDIKVEILFDFSFKVGWFKFNPI